MAYVTNFNPEEQQNQAQGNVSPGGASNTVKLSPNGGVGSAGAAPTSGNGATPNAGGQFATLQSYVNANQGQAMPLSNNITGGIQNQYNTLQGQNQNVLSGIGKQVDSGYTKQNQDILAQEATNPVSFASDPTNIQSFQGQLNDKYTGPTKAESVSDYQNQIAAVNNAIAQGKAQTGSDAGRQQLLTQYEKAPTKGVTGLNSAILAQDPNAQANIEQAYQPFSNLVSGLSTGAQGLNEKIGNAQTEAKSASDIANQQISKQANDLNTAISNQLKTAQDQYQSNNANQGLTAAISAGQSLTPEQAKLLNVDPNSYQSALKLAQLESGLYGDIAPNAGQYYTPGDMITTPPTPQNVATADQYNMANALQSLAGVNPFNIPIDQTTFNQAGGFNANVPPPKLDLGKMQSDIQNQFSNDDLKYIEKSNAGPIDPFKLPPAPGGTGYIDKYGPDAQAAAKAAKVYLDKFGAGYYPMVDQRWTDALDRLISGQY